MPHPLHDFHPAVRRWFEKAHGSPTPPQELGWPSIASGAHTLILAPTGSGKTLAAFLWAVNHLVEEHLTEEPQKGVRVLYVSPLKALNNDIARNLEGPLRGIREEARNLGIDLPPITTAVRTGDTPSSRRAAMIRRPPAILITTPESLYLMLTSPRARGMFRTVRYLIVDEIHSLAGNKRGVHLSLSMERLLEVTDAEPVRIGLSATQRPLARIARFLGGLSWEGDELMPRPVEIIDAGRRKSMDLSVDCPVPDLSLLSPEGIWPELFTRLLELIRTHRTTLVFVNNRRLAERVAAALNDRAAGRESEFNLRAVPSGGARTPREETPALVQAYHGSMSRAARERMEEELKRGALRALVATSSLELGIDIGSIDLVVQLQSPKGIARGLQRIGRSGHLVAATSRGRMVPTHAGDLVESAVVARAMAAHDVEETTVPANCLDVLAQQIVAMVSVEEWEEVRLFRLVRRSACYENLPHHLFAGVLRMLAGRTRDSAPAALRPRISRDVVHGILRALPGSGRLAVTSGGTISDRGTFGVYLEDGSTRIGEVDEEFVFESRPGDTFILGSSVWRMKEIDAHRVLVRPAPGEPARMPFWRGEGIGRSPALGALVGAFLRESEPWLEGEDALVRLRREFPLDQHAAWNIREHLRRQREATGGLPHDRLMVVEGFRDEIGDPRIVVHSPWGRRVNGLLAVVLEQRLHSMTGIRPQTLYNDDGVLLRSPHAEELPLGLLSGLTPGEAERIILQELPSSPLFAGQFRQNAARALLHAGRSPGKRTPLWVQRLRAADLLAATAGNPDFPIMIETAREVLTDVLDYGAFMRVVGGIAAGEIGVRMLVTETPSPFAAGLLFDFLQVYMYEPDRSPADAGVSPAALGRENLPDLPGPALSDGVLRPEAADAVEARLQHTAEGFRARSPEELYEILVSTGPLSPEELPARCAADAASLIGVLASDGRALQLRVGDEQRWVAAEDADLYSDPEAEANARKILTRFLASRGPVQSRDAARRFGIPISRVAGILDGLVSSDPGIRRLPGERYAYRRNLEHMYRISLGILRKEIEPVPVEVFAAFQLQWQHLASPAILHGEDAVDRCVGQLQGLDLPADLWEREIIGRRVAGGAGTRLRALTAGGALVWAGTGGGKLRPVLRGEGASFLPPQLPDDNDPPGPQAGIVMAALEKGGALFLQDLRAETGLSLAALNRAIAVLVRRGLITNDTFDELLHVGRGSPAPPDEPDVRIEMLDPRHNPRRASLMQTVRKALRNVPGWSGRWSPLRTAGVCGAAPAPEEMARIHGVQLLRRYGILPRVFHRREDLLPWALIARELNIMEMRGEIRRGHFVRGLPGMQYALPEAADALRSLLASGHSRELVLVNCCDPAHPFGPGLEPAATGGLSPSGTRVPSSHVVYRGGTTLLWIEAHGSRIWMEGTITGADLREGLRLFLKDRDGVPDAPSRRTLGYINGTRPVHSPWEAVLRELGFRGDRNQTMTREREL